jgi:hypothetical protein
MFSHMTKPVPEASIAASGSGNSPEGNMDPQPHVGNNSSPPIAGTSLLPSVKSLPVPAQQQQQQQPREISFEDLFGRYISKRPRTWNESFAELKAYREKVRQCPTTVVTNYLVF